MGFDDVVDFRQKAYKQNSGIFPPYGTSDYALATLDTTVKASGNGSLKFTIPARSGSDSSGSYFTNFSSDLSVQFGESATFFIQWRQRFSPAMISAIFAGGGGFKQVIVGTGDQPGRWFDSCTDLEVVVTNNNNRGFPQMYNSCGSYIPFEEAFTSPLGSYDFKLQNARQAPNCLYLQKNSSYFPPVGNCFGYVANEWMTFQIGIKTGPRVNDKFTNSYVYLWGAREGKASEPIIAWGPYDLAAGPAGQNQRFGKVWLLPYNTGKDASVTNPVAYTWYDELIISRNRIADPQ